MNVRASTHAGELFLLIFKRRSTSTSFLRTKGRLLRDLSVPFPNLSVIHDAILYHQPSGDDSRQGDDLSSAFAILEHELQTAW
jgi:hypothetical protein